MVLSWGLTWPANKVILETISPYWLATTRTWIAVSAAALGEPITVSLLVAVATILGGIAIGTTGRGPG